MSKFLRLIALSNWKLAFTAMTLALLLLIGAADLIVRNNGIQASGIEQDRVYQVREGNRLREVIKIEDMVNINSPEFPKEFQIKSVPSAGWRIREIPCCASSPKPHN